MPLTGLSTTRDFLPGAIAPRPPVGLPSRLPSALSGAATSTNTGATLPPAVAAVGELTLTGNLIPPIWYHHLKLPSGRPDLVGCTLLAEIVYQYRPVAVCDERTGQVLYYRKRFTRDQFCAPLAYFENKFALTTDQIRKGLKRLEQGGFIVREYRTLSVAGSAVHGMTFIEPVPQAISALSIQPTGAKHQEDPRGEVLPVREPAAEPDGAVWQPEGAAQRPLYKDTSTLLVDEPTTPPTSPTLTAETPSAPQEGCCCASSKNTSDDLISSPTKQSDTTETSCQILPTATPEAQEPDINRALDNSPPLVFDFHLAHLSEPEKTQFRQRLGRLPAPLAQRVLDEYNSAVGRGKSIHSRWSWLEYLIRKAQSGEFIPTSDLAERRQALADARTMVKLTEEPERRLSTVWKAHREELAQHFEPGEYHTYVLPLRGVEEHDRLWLEAPNSYVVDWVTAHWTVFETTLGSLTELVIGVRLEAG